MAIVFCFDDLGPNPDLGYPNLAARDLVGDQFDSTWPRCIPLRLLMYLQRAGIEFSTCSVDRAPRGAWYPVALAWHDHSINYFYLMSSVVLYKLKQKLIRVLFYYHEGDSPQHIKTIMDQQAAALDLPLDCYSFVSANSAADLLDNFVFFSDHEHFFQYVNRRQLPNEIDLAPRQYEFTALSRTHKWWRAAVMSDIWWQGSLARSLWSYNTLCAIDDDETQNPLRIYEFDGWLNRINQFISGGPYVCDSQTESQHNDHRFVNLDLYTKSYCHLVLETHLDADSSGGAFITEKTYKCIKHAQPFVIIGAPGSLACLRSQGYRVFDHVLDNGYDEISDNTDRWLAIKQLIKDLQQKDLHQWFLSCSEDLRHNQDLFMKQTKSDVEKLAQYLDTVK